MKLGSNRNVTVSNICFKVELGEFIIKIEPICRSQDRDLLVLDFSHPVNLISGWCKIAMLHGHNQAEMNTTRDKFLKIYMTRVFDTGVGHDTAS